MIRIAIPLLIGFLGLLVFLYFRGVNRHVNQMVEISALRDELLDYERLLQEIRIICNDSRDVDPSAELILMTIRNYPKKELA